MSAEASGGEGRFRRGIRLARASWDVVRSDRELLLFPALQLASTVVAAFLIFVPAIVASDRAHSRWPIVVAVVVGAYVSNTLGTFFGVGFVAIGRRALAGETATAKEGFRCARARLWPILEWSLVSTLVGLALRALEQVRVGGLATLAARWVLGAAWALATFFVVPVIALENAGPIAAARRSGSVVRQRWGESVTGASSIGIVFAILLVPAVVLMLIGAAVIDGSPLVGTVLFLLAIAMFVVVVPVATTVSQLFRLVLFEYATGGGAVAGFAEADLERAFRPKRGLFGRRKR